MSKNNSHNETHFYCDKCGLCCSHLDLFGDSYKELNRGDGTCIYFNEQNRLCNIYNDRPDICNVEKGYILFFSKLVSYQKYIDNTTEGCNKLKIMFKFKG